MIRKYITNLNNWINSDNRKPILLRGARQVGKSTLVRDFAKSRGLRLYEFNLEKLQKLKPVFKTLQIKEILEALEGVVNSDIQSSNSLVFFDEIQAIPEALAALRYFYEDRPELAVIAAGSLVEFTLADHEFSMPVGRIEYLHIQPMSFGEVLRNSGNDWLYEKWAHFKLGDSWPDTIHSQLLEILRQYMVHGGMPAVVLAKLTGKGNAAVSRTLNSIHETYRDDFPKYATRAQSSHLQICYDRLPATIGQKINYASISPAAKAASVRHAIGLLHSAGVVRKIHYSSCQGLPLAAQIDDRIYKTYWLDVGLLNCALGLPARKILAPTVHEGPMAEQFICQQLAGLGGGLRGPEIFYWIRDGQKQNAEVDFVVQIDGEVIPIEVKSGKKGSLKSLQQFMLTHQHLRAIKLSGALPSTHFVEAKPLPNQTLNATTYTLIELPLYFAERLNEILADLEEESN
jgi:predicted AAA+ superfamily ATPase